jgi:peptidoglycan/xylan/chitin deacetylase (PgdA/CDA1 family)
LKATFFVCSGRLDRPTFLTREHLRKMRGAGMEIGSHGIQHCSWRRRNRDWLRKELTESRDDLEAASGGPIATAACPFGAYDRSVLWSVREAGYQRIFTCDRGVADERCWLQSRTTLTRTTTLKEVEELVHAGVNFREQLGINLRTFIKRLR